MSLLCVSYNLSNTPHFVQAALLICSEELPGVMGLKRTIALYTAPPLTDRDALNAPPH